MSKHAVVPTKPQAVMTVECLEGDNLVEGFSWSQSFSEFLVMEVEGNSPLVIRDYINRKFTHDQDKVEGLIERAEWFHFRNCRVNVVTVQTGKWMTDRINKFICWCLNLLIKKAKAGVF